MTRKRSPETPEQKRKRRARENARKARKREKLKAERAAKAGAVAFSKTSAAYRQIHFGMAPEMTKSELRNMLAQAVRNTAAIGALP